MIGSILLDLCVICFTSSFYDYISNHHHHIVLAARISLTLSRHSSLSFIALGRSSGQKPVSSHSCWMYVRAGRPAFARPCVGIHKSTSLMSSSLLLQQCPACLVRLTWIVFVIGGRWPYSWCLVGCCCQDYHQYNWNSYFQSYILDASRRSSVMQLSSLPILGYFCIISAPTETQAWLWKRQAASLIATCYAPASTKAKKKKIIRPDFGRSYRHLSFSNSQWETGHSTLLYYI